MAAVVANLSAAVLPREQQPEPVEVPDTSVATPGDRPTLPKSPHLRLLLLHPPPLHWLMLPMRLPDANPPPNGWVTIPKRLLNVKEWKFPKKMIKIHTATMDPNKFIAMCLHINLSHVV